MTEQPHRRILDAYLQGAHLALLALQGKIRGRTDLTAEDLQAVLDDLHDVFAQARRSLKEGDPVIGAGLVAPLQHWKN